MKILAFDTSSASGSIALTDDDALVAEWTSARVSAHAVWLLPSVCALLKGVGIGVNDVGLFAVTNGPGSFTGLRIGVSVAKGLAWPLGKKVAGVSSLYALAKNADYAGIPVCPLLDARKAEVYAALYGRSNGSMKAMMPECAVTPSELYARLKELNLRTPVLFLGNGLKTYGDDVRRNVKDAVLAPEPLWHVRAVNVALAASEKMRAAEPVDPAALSLVYLRKSEAEVKAAVDKPANIAG